VLDQITPVLLTYNEAPNIERTLERLAWARDIVVVDSFSDDATLGLISRFPQTRVLQRQFDTHAQQWNFALTSTAITTEWVLALDADYVLSDGLVSELKALTADPDISGFRASFIYVIHGKPLRGSAYPPVTILYRRNHAEYVQDGHTQRVVVQGRVERLEAPVLHDDRKPLDRWIASQRRYMKLEARKLAARSWRNAGWKGRVRKLKVIAPIAVGFYCLFVKGAVLDGGAGLLYSAQRVFSEILLSLYLIESELMAARHSAPYSAEAVEPR
jgi:glycosyltransferase involved in cell wall biosynthesis